MQVDETFSTLLGQLYQGPLEEPPFAAFLAAMREHLGANLVTLVLRPPSPEGQAVMLADGGSLSAMRSYNEGQFVLDPFVDLPTGEVFSLHEYLSSETLLESDFYRIIMQPQGWYDFLGVDLREEGEMDVRFRAGRYSGGSAFGSEDKELLAALLPHLQRAIRLQARISRSERERAVYAGAVEQLQVATIILDEQGEVVSCNEAAAELVASGSAISLPDKRPQLSDRAADIELTELLSNLRNPGNARPVPAAAMQIPNPGEGPDLGLVARAVPSTDSSSGTGTPSVALFISNPQQTAAPQLQVVSRLFDLTPTEASLALLLANGLSLDEASAQLAISRNTGRAHLRSVFAKTGVTRQSGDAHLRSVFAKTGVTRQSGLVRLILRSVAPLAGECSP